MSARMCHGEIKYQYFSVGEKKKKTCLCVNKLLVLGVEHINWSSIIKLFINVTMAQLFKASLA